jgi:beta-ketodecanoyl-[acyl-carrier-protein] synthase
MGTGDVANARTAGDLPGSHPVITGRGWHVPEDVLTNADVAARLDEGLLRAWVGSNRWCQERLEGKADLSRAEVDGVFTRYVEERIGIKQRRVIDRAAIVEGRASTNGVFASDLGAVAVTNAIKAAGIEPADVEVIICATGSPDRVFPSTGTEIQARVGAEGAHAYDVSAACTGFGYALHIARALIASGMHRRVVVVCAEYFTAMVNYSDPNNSFFWGDGAAAVVVERADLAGDKAGLAIIDSHCVSLPSQCIRTGLGGTRPFLAGAARREGMSDAEVALGAPDDPYFYQDGRQVYRDVVRTVSKETAHLISRNDIEVESIRRFWFHQPSLPMLNAIVKRLIATDASDERIALTLSEYGNTSSTGSALCLAQDDGLQPGDWGCVSVFGGGYTVSTVLLRKLA